MPDSLDTVQKGTGTTENVIVSSVYAMRVHINMHNMHAYLISIRISKELTSQNNVFIVIGKVPSHNRWILATADDSASIELQFEDPGISTLVV